MYLKRDLEKQIRKFLHTPEIIAILGTRQVGKTTLLKNLFENNPDCKFITFEDRNILTMFREDLESFSKLYLSDNKILIIDEFQYAREGGQKLKFLFDTIPGKKIIISGSSSFDLTKQAIKFMVGRIFQFQLYPFSFYEFLSYKDEEGLNLILIPFIRKVQECVSTKEEKLPELSTVISNSFAKEVDEYSIYGGFPRVVLTNDKEEKQVILKNIFSTYLLKEIREILNLTDDFKIEKLAKYLGLRISDLLLTEDVSGFVGTNHKKTVQLLNILEKTFIVELLNPFYTNKLLEIIKSKKVYFSDPGFRNAVIQNFQEIDLRTDKGALYENFVFSELQKAGKKVKYWRTKSKAEVDFILEINSKLIPIEVKSNLTKPVLQRSLISFIKKYRPEIAFILSRDYYDVKKYENTIVYFLPLFLMGAIGDL